MIRHNYNFSLKYLQLYNKKNIECLFLILHFQNLKKSISIFLIRVEEDEGQKS